MIKNFYRDTVVALVSVLGLTGAFYLYQTSHFVENEFLRICNALYSTPPIMYEICVKPYSDQVDFLRMSLKAESVFVFVMLLLLTILRIKKQKLVKVV